MDSPFVGFRVRVKGSIVHGLLLAEIDLFPCLRSISLMLLDKVKGLRASRSFSPVSASAMIVPCWRVPGWIPVL